MSHIMLCAGWHERREESRASAPDPLFAKRFLRACFKLLGWEPTGKKKGRGFYTLALTPSQTHRSAAWLPRR
jgi:hypothetical protein